jgi:hypothetical protein
MPDLLGPNPWRPEGWVNPEDLPEDGPLDGLDDCGIYEAGADAMLEALKAGGVRADARELCRDSNYCRNTQCMNCPFNGTGPGTLIFIPEAQE